MNPEEIAKLYLHEPQTPDSVLFEAESLVHGARRQSYGTPAENHGRTAAMWSAYLGVPINAQDVCMLNVLQKVSRFKHGQARDNLVDIAGYAENANLCAPHAGRPGQT